MFETQEIARNPTPEIRVKCISCKAEYSIVSSLQEIPLKVDYGSIVEGVLICPHCHNQKHVYYMTEHLRNEQRLLQRRALDWQNYQTSDNYRKLIAKKQAYQHEYDRIQNKYQKELKHGSSQK